MSDGVVCPGLQGQQQRNGREGILYSGSAHLEQTHGKNLNPLWVNALPCLHPDINEGLQ